MEAPTSTRLHVYRVTEYVSILDRLVEAEEVENEPKNIPVTKPSHVRPKDKAWFQPRGTVASGFVPQIQGMLQHYLHMMATLVLVLCQHETIGNSARATLGLVRYIRF